MKPRHAGAIALDICSICETLNALGALTSSTVGTIRFRLGRRRSVPIVKMRPWIKRRRKWATQHVLNLSGGIPNELTIRAASRDYFDGDYRGIFRMGALEGHLVS